MFYTSEAELVFSFSKQTFEALSSEKPHQISGGVNDDDRLHQVGGEMSFPVIFGFVPWCHYVEIITMETKNIGKGSFAGTKKDAKYTCPKGKKKEYQKILKKRGASGTFTEAKK